MWWATGVVAALIALAILVPAVTGVDVHVNSFPPLHAEWMPRLGPGTIPALVLAVAAARWGVGLARRVPWRALLWVVFGASALWMASLAFVDTASGLGAILASRHEYLPTAEQVVDDVPAMLREFTSRIPWDAPDNWPIHVAGHPPGALLFFVALVRLGLGSWVVAGAVVILIASTTAVAVLVAMRRLGAEVAARRAAPFLAMGPAAIWTATSADAVFAATAAWGLCLLAHAATASMARALAWWAVGAGLLLGWCVMLSYGLPLLGVLSLTVLALGRSWWPLPLAAASALVVVLAFVPFGFAWWEAFPVLVERYWEGAAVRPGWYWTWANLAALACTAGPVVGAATASAVGGLARSLRHRPSGRELLVASSLSAAALATVLLADASQMSRSEVERIWLPFVPWLLVGTALLPLRWRRAGFVVQLGFALVVQHLLHTGW
ncbi:hypothetical protein GLX25_01370 [Agromyces luteolus]|uniref:Integral membrane protein n=1 Tax=Agromyces luteolus TaxID=88373 RepID=A0A7C9HP61_9MICO|nr:hypothetical protein [Agromyces luteolus]